jgi:tRNA-2-methylthio-N6-dimethylallyladenosine synthase
MPAVFVETFGCQMNVADSQALIDSLRFYGYHTATRYVDADLLVVNTCSVRKHAEQRARARIAEYSSFIKRHHNDKKLWVIGCMAERRGDTLRKEYPEIDAVIGAIKMEYIDTFLPSLLGTDTSAVSPSPSAVKSISEFVPVMRGCNNFCSYCIVPYVRGREHSLGEKSIVERICHLADRGTKEVTLLGQNVNSYNDNGTDFASLLTQVHDIDGIERIRFTTSHPKDCSEKLIRTIADYPKLSNHIHLPVQSGATRILHLMNRHYTAEEYLHLIDMIRGYIPDADITTDVMTGFPTETEEDFEQTLSMFRAVRFTTAFMFKYSPRPGTNASSMKSRVDDTAAKHRLQRLIELQTAITKELYGAMVGKTVTVLFTERQKGRDRMWIGRDYGNKRVLIPCQKNLAGTILQVRIKKSSGMTLIGERID